VRLPLALLLGIGALVVGCGDDDQGRPPAKADRPSEHFQNEAAKTSGSQPPSYQKATAEARSTGQANGYTYVHAHMELHLADACLNASRTSNVDWATGDGGRCTGSYIGGSEPFNNTRGQTEWLRVGTGTGRPAPRELVELGAGPYIRITDRVGTKSVACYILDRNQQECYTQGDQKGKPPNSEGGPLQLTASFQGSSRYVFLRGFCASGDILCTPH